MLSLVAVHDRETYDAVRALTTKPEQSDFIAPPLKTLADAYVFGFAVRAARFEKSVVGLVMIGSRETGGVMIFRLMIDAGSQGRGLGRALLAATLDWAAEAYPDARRVRISAVPENDRALDLYRRAGFVDVGFERGEIVLERPMRSS